MPAEKSSKSKQRRAGHQDDRRFLSRIPGTAFERSLRVVGFGLKTGMTAITKTRTLLQQAEALTKLMGEMKGSMMKAGQLLGMVGEHFFPPEINAVLRTLNAQSDPVAWPEINKALVRRLGKERLAQLEIDEEPWAAASLGQVHRARIKSTGTELCLKIQYPGVAKSIESDLKQLRLLLRTLGVLPGNFNDKPIFSEVRSMLRREVDYDQEKSATRKYADLVAGDSRFKVPDVFDEFSTSKILATSWIDSVELDSPGVLALPDRRRQKIAKDFLELFFAEFFIWNFVQTDPHFGNFRVKLGDDLTSDDRDQQQDQLVLLDFGAVRRFDREFVRRYAAMVRASLDGDRQELIDAGKSVGILPMDASDKMTDLYVELCLAVVEPFTSGVFDWRASDLPKRCSALGVKLVFEGRLPSPPKELLFLDRKLGGVFTVLSHLGARIDGREILEKAVNHALNHADPVGADAGEVDSGF